MKKIISFILILSFLPPILCSALNTTTQSKIEDYNPIEKEIWDILRAEASNDIITAAIMGYFQRESFLQSDAVAGYHYDKLHNICADYNTIIDDGLEDGSSYNQFMHDTQFIYGGYGLGQWSNSHSLDSLYWFAQLWETEFSNIEMQCAFVIQDMKNNYPWLWEQLNKIKNPYDAGCLVGIEYEGTASYEITGEYAYVFYERYSEKN